MAEVVLALGSNLGDRMGFLRRAVRELSGVMEISAVSGVVETPAREVESGPPQGDYLNAVIRGRTDLEPRALLDACLRAEEGAGRTRAFEKAPRTLDVDVLFYDDRVVRRPGLTIPHPRWKDRDFVLVPLLEVAPGWVDPETGRRVEEIVRERASRSAGPARPRRVAGPKALTREERP